MRRSNEAWLVGDVGYMDVSTPRFPRAVAVFDAADWNLVLDIGTRSRWHVMDAPTAQTLYVCRHIGRGSGALVLLHRVLLGLGRDDSSFVDHRDRDGLNNRRANLRRATREQNGRNRVGHGRTGYKGVTQRSHAYIARIRVDGELRHLGCFPTPEAAAGAYDAAAREAFGAFAYLNFPIEVAA